MRHESDPSEPSESCPLPQPPELSGIKVVGLRPRPPLADYRAAMGLANAEAADRLGDYMLLSWYDRDRDFESPQQASECHAASTIPGYVDYGIHHGATLILRKALEPPRTPRAPILSDGWRGQCY
ncbi:MAG: AF1514 family protein [Chromatiaceae bacterium]